MSLAKHNKLWWGTLEDVNVHGRPAAGESFTPYAGMVSQKEAIPDPAVSD
jgi:hypothetical protein